MAAPQKKVYPKCEATMIEGARLIHNAFWKRDQFDEKAAPMYRFECAFKKGDKSIEDFLGKVADYAEEAHGPFKGENDPYGIFDIDGGYLACGVKDGDKMAEKLAREGKNGAVYKDHWVVRASTQYNADGADAEGGAKVVDEDAQPVTPLQAGKVYNGCYGRVVVTLGAYTEAKTGYPGIKVYMNGFQKTADGEKLLGSDVTAGLFKPVGRAEGGETPTRRRRGGA